MRGTAGQMALAEWLLNQLDRPAKRTGPCLVSSPESKDDVVRLMYLTNTGTPQEFVKFATRIRSDLKFRRRSYTTRPEPSQSAEPPNKSRLQSK
jgi:hypothetical protein